MKAVKIKKLSDLDPKTKILVSLAGIAIGIGIVVLVCYLSFHNLFPANVRMVLRNVDIEGTGGYWSGANYSDQENRRKELIELLGLNPGHEGIFSVSLSELRKKVLDSLPEVESVEVRRIIPDTISFRFTERVPRAVLSGHGNMLIDDKGVIFDWRKWRGMTENLPKLTTLSPASSRKYQAGDRLTDPETLLAIEFIKICGTEYPKIRIDKIVVITKTSQMQADVFYGDDPKPFKVRMPANMSSAKLHDDMMGRLASALEIGVNAKTGGRNLTLNFENQVIVTK